MPTARLQRILAEAGLCSRRQAEEWIREGRVAVNGKTAAIGDQADPARDEITVRGRPLPKARPRVYWLVNKPAGYTSSVRDRHAKHLVTDLIPPGSGRVYPVGRLDTPSRGLLLLTDDGWLAHRLMHPSFNVPKVYELWVEGYPGPARLERIQRGLTFEEGLLRAESAQVLERDGQRSRVLVTLREGRKRELRRLFEAVGNPVIDLVRTRYGPLSLEGLPEGACRPLQDEEIRALYRSVGGRERAVGEVSAVRSPAKEQRFTGGAAKTRPADPGRRQKLDAPRPRHPVRERRGDSKRSHR